MIRNCFFIVLLLLSSYISAGQEPDSYIYRDVYQVLQAAKDYQMHRNNHVLALFTEPEGIEVTRENVIELLDYVYSQQKCRCVVSPYSSYMPHFNEYSTLGGIAMDMIDAYRQDKRYPEKAWTCTKTDRARADEIIQWWNREKEK